MEIGAPSLEALPVGTPQRPVPYHLKLWGAPIRGGRLVVGWVKGSGG